MNFPFFIGNSVSKIPYEARPGIGGLYKIRKEEISMYENLTHEKRKDWIFENTKSIAVHAYENVKFYKDLYRDNNVNPRDFESFHDLSMLPIVTKSMLMDVPLKDRSFSTKHMTLVNTGGSSGKPLSFHITPNSIPHEWAHMHHAWSQLGFKQSDLKLTFSGRSNLEQPVAYDSARHQFNVNIYLDNEQIAEHLLKIYKKYQVKFIHGYPSAIFSFCKYLEKSNHVLLSYLREQTRGLLLGSEYPDPKARKEVEDLLGCKSLSFYGHTERCILASDCNNLFTPLMTYGYAESVDVLGETHLVGTSYYNLASPLVRYDTEDIIQANVDDCLLRNFYISKGRNGEFIYDASGNKIHLTALIFGRHHKLFEYTFHVQVRSVSKGMAEILYVPIDKDLEEIKACTYFDSSNVDIEFTFKKIDKPILSSAGKVNLLV